MSKMKNLIFDICAMFRKGYSIKEISEIVGLPKDQIICALKYDC